MSEILGTIVRLPMGISRFAVETLSAALPGQVLFSGLELIDKLEAFELFQSARGKPDLEIARAWRLDPWSRLWVLEGVGYSLGLAGGALPSADPAALIPLGTGLGLGLAARSLNGLRAGSLAGGLRAFAACCRDATPPGLAGAAFEGLGLAVRTLVPTLAPGIGRALADLDRGLEGLFWHGVGRALFFVPTNILPLGDPSGRAVDKAWREPPCDSGRRNALAGLGWAMTLVGLRHPRALDDFLFCHADGIPAPDAFSHGVAAAVQVWARSAGRDELLDRFLSHPSVAPGIWDAWVRHPCERALVEIFPVLERGGQWEELFRVAS
jgi:hypothetical protein